MVEELDKILGEEENETPPTPPEEKPKEPPQEEKNDEVEEQEKKRLEDLKRTSDAAKAAEEELRKIRTIKKKVRKVASGEEDDDDELPAIDTQDPNVRAWDKHLSEKVEPVSKQIEMEKDEVRGLALKDFLADKPALAKDSDKLKRVMENYHALASGRITERVKDKVVETLEKAYAAENHEELREKAHKEEVDKAKAEGAFSGVAVSQGSTAYPSSKPDKMPPLDDEKRAMIKKMGYASPEAWWADKQKYPGEVETDEEKVRKLKEEKSS